MSDLLVTSIFGATKLVVVLSDERNDNFVLSGTKSTIYDLDSVGGAVDSVAGLVGVISASGLKSALAISSGDVSGLATVATSGAYGDLSGTPALGSLASLSSLASSSLSDHTTAGVSMFTAATVAAQTALLNAVVGDSGSGGTAGLVPAPASGSAAAGKFLKADGTWSVPSGGGNVSTSGTPAQYGLPVFASSTTIGSLGTGTTSQVLVGGGSSANPAFGSVPVAALPAMVGDSGSGGTAGIVPAPGSGTAAAGKFLKADGTWSVPSGGGSLTSPVAIGSATLLTTPAAGDLEYDGHALYFDPVANVRGVVPAFQHSHVTAGGGVSLSNVATAQSFLPSGAQNFPVEAGIIYRFKAKIPINMNTTTAGTKNFLIATGGSAAFSWIDYVGTTEQGSALYGGNSPTVWHSATAAASTISPLSSAQYMFHMIEGSFAMSSGGTIQPQIQFSAAPGGTCTNMQGSYFELYTYGASAASAGLS